MQTANDQVIVKINPPAVKSYPDVSEPNSKQQVMSRKTYNAKCTIEVKEDNT